MPFANDPTTAIRAITERIEPALIEIRRDIHAHPELAFEEGVRDPKLTAEETLGRRRAEMSGMVHRRRGYC